MNLETTNVTGMITTRNSWVAAALLTNDECPLYDCKMPISAYIDDNGKEIYTFKFKDTEMARRVIAAFDNEEAYVKQYPEDWITHLLAYKHNYARLIDYIKQCPKRQIVRKGNKIFLIPIAGKN
jgi:hypothetical protein